MPSLDTPKTIAHNLKHQLLQAVDQADRTGNTPSDTDLGIAAHIVTTVEIAMLFRDDHLLFLSVTPSGAVIDGRIEANTRDGHHVEALNGSELEYLADLFSTRIDEAAKVLRRRKHIAS